ncbi:hypothetical protein AAA536_07860 [Pseudomonas aeruginosa]|nr:hypothetical protein [Pseudomonas aeruginosa]
MKTREQELNDLILSYSAKTEHELSKAIKTFTDKGVALNKELGESEASINTLSIAGYKARNDHEALPAIEAQITALEAKQKAITEEISYIKAATARLSEIHVWTQIKKVLKKHNKLSLKAVEDMIKQSL